MIRVNRPTDEALATSSDLQAALKRSFGHSDFRPHQQPAIEAFLAGRDVLTIMPTGGGKSLCYQLPAVLRPGVTLVVSPLIALMEDQVKALQMNGISAAFINSSLAADEARQCEIDALTGRYQLLYLAPERLMGNAGQRLLSQLQLSAIAVDEAHCISEWGHDFRPEYRMLGALRGWFNGRFARTPLIALTATATPRVAEDVATQLQLRDPLILRGSFERQNLYYEVRPKQGAFNEICRYLDANPEHEGIIYCQSRATTEELASRLRDRGVNALPYHAGLDHRTRQRHQHEFVYGSARVMTATIAFGMGIDKPDVRFVFHIDLPRHLEGYYQETGRAGRDGLPSDCILFFSHGDRAKIEHFITQKPSESEREHARWQLDQVIAFAYATGCRCQPLLHYFGQEHPGGCNHCDNCRLPPQEVDVTEDARKLLSAVVRTEQRFGLGHVIQVLRGGSNERIERYRHHDLSVYGIGKDRPVTYWKLIAQTLLHQGKLGQTAGEYPTVHLTADSMPVLRGQEDFTIIQPRAASTGKRKEKTRSRGKAAQLELTGPVETQLFERLRKLRWEHASQQGVPPYMVFSDVALRHMAINQPTDLTRFAQISGVGERKLEQYGEAFTAAIREFLSVD